MANTRAKGSAAMLTFGSKSSSRTKRNSRSASALKMSMLTTLATATIAVPIASAAANAGEEVETTTQTLEAPQSVEPTTKLPTAQTDYSASQYVNISSASEIDAISEDVLNADGSYTKIAPKGVWQDPAPGAKITSPFGYRIHPTLGYSKMHNGIDLSDTCGSPILAAEEGKVIEVGYHSISGNLVKVEHADGLITEYFHLQSYQVKEGDQLKKGQELGKMGNTGLSTGCHLHFGLMRGEGNYLNPMSLWG